MQAEWICLGEACSAANMACGSCGELVMLTFVVIWLQLAGRSVEEFDAKPAFACDRARNPDASAWPFCDTSLLIQDRVKDLVSRLTLEEKALQLGNNAPAISRLGIPEHEWWSEALHGVGYSPGVTFGGAVPGATSFPQVILTAASMNRTLWYQIAQAVSTEGRAMYNLGRSGLTYWSPNINIFRDPRWGRGQETPGEDPRVNSQYARSYARGLQGEELELASDSDPQFPLGHDRKLQQEKAVAPPQYLKTCACCKHFTAYDLDHWMGVSRYHFNAVITAQDLEDTYNVPFKRCVEEGHAASVMCSYNSVNGIPMCADYNLVTGKLVNDWRLSGYIVSDCNAVGIIHDSYNYTYTPEDTVAAALHAGLNLDCGTYFQENIVRAVETGKVNESTVDGALSNLFTVRMRLRLFDGDPATLDYGKLGVESICSQEHQALALDAARQGIVLLKNENSLLPLTGVESLALIGPHGDATDAMLGNYYGAPCNYITPKQGLEAYAQVTFTPGCENVVCADDSGISEAATTAARADVAVIVVGLDSGQEAEDRDRTSLLLPSNQQNLVEDSTAAAAAAGKRVVLVLMCGGPLDVTFAKQDARIESILWVGYPGQSGGQALAEILFGHHSPSGRLPVTWYPEQLAETVDMTNMNMRPDPATNYPGRTYRFYTGATVYNFGHGIQGYNGNTFQPAFLPERSPATFDLSAAGPGRRKSGPRQLRCSELGDDDAQSAVEPPSFQLHVQVSNNGTRDGSYTALLFTQSPAAGADHAPLKELVGLERLHVAAGSTAHHAFTIRPCHHLSTVAADGSRVLKPGLHRFSLDQSFHQVALTLQGSQ